jgi:NADH dehydrogenase
MTRIVILGGGFAGLGVARALTRSRRRAQLDVTIVNRENFLLFTPMLPEVSSGSVEPRHIAQPIRSALRGRARFVLGSATAVDLDSRSVKATHSVTGEVTEITYDHLVIALGSDSSTHGVPGAQGHSVPLKTLDDAVCVRSKIIAAFEAAAVAQDDVERRRLRTFAVVGGGFAGVECAGELLAYLRAIRKQYPAADRPARMILVAGTGRLLEQLPQRFGDRAAQMLVRRGTEVVFEDDVASVDAGGLTLKSGKRFETGTVVWCAGVGVSRLVEHLALEHSKHHAIVVDADMSVPGRPGVWALGDCAQIPKPGGGSYPQTAQHAVREAPLLARNIEAAIRGRSTRPFRYREAGMMASLGDREGLADIAGRTMVSGLPAWLMWRAYYLARLPGAYRKARVALDWALSLPFPQDITSIE